MEKTAKKDEINQYNIHKKYFTRPTINILVFIGWFFLFSCVSYAEDNKNNLAVSAFEGKNVSMVDASVFSDMLRTEIVNLNVVKVVDKANMDKILAESAFQQTGCTTFDCAVQIGKILNVHKMVVGSLSKVEGIYCANANYVDVETGRIEKSETLTCEKVKDFIPMAKEIAIKLLNVKGQSASYANKYFVVKYNQSLSGSVVYSGNGNSLERDVETGSGISMEYQNKLSSKFVLGIGYEHQFDRQQDGYSPLSFPNAPRNAVSNSKFNIDQLYGTLEYFLKTNSKIKPYIKVNIGYPFINGKANFKGAASIGNEFAWGLGGGLIFKNTIILELIYNSSSATMSNNDIDYLFRYNRIDISAGYRFDL